ncbi:MAG: hypothetical protein P4M11_04235 [Candidatus Pacebacteria bacterium]|nr:hypothetical protein [Candidatus Paceibacterota bacterium]
MNYLCDSYNRIANNPHKIDQVDVDYLTDCVRRKAVNLFLKPEAYYPATEDDQPSKDCFEMLQWQGASNSSSFFSGLLSDLMMKNCKVFNGLIGKLYGICLDVLSQLTEEDEPTKWHNVLGAVIALVQKREAAELFMKTELRLLKSAKPKYIEHSTVLGNALRFSFADTAYALKYFSSNGTSNLTRSTKALSESVKDMQSYAENIVSKLLYKTHRLPEVLLWFVKVANMNAERSKMQHSTDVSSRSFLLNVFQLLLSILGDVTANSENYPKFASRIQPGFCNAVIVDSNLNYCNCDQMDMESAKRALKKEGPFDDLTQLFFLAHYYMNLFFEEMVSYINKRFSQRRLHPREDLHLRVIFSFCVHLLAPQFMSQLSDFLAFTSCVIMSSIVPSGNATLQEYLQHRFRFPFPPVASEALAIFPEHLIKNVHQVFVFYITHPVNEFFKPNNMLLLLMSKLYISLLTMPYMSNKHVRAKLTEFFGLLVEERQSGKFSQG